MRRCRSQATRRITSRLRLWTSDEQGYCETCRNFDGGQGRNRTVSDSLECVSYSVFNIIEFVEFRELQFGSTN
jgi:hypothetical protein